MARTARIESETDAYYHIVSRCNNRSFLFSEGRLKDTLKDLLERAAAFSGVELRAFCLMDNHFHLVVKVVKPETEIPADEVIRRIGVLKGPAVLGRLQASWKNLGEAALESRLAPYRRRMHRLGEFVKTFKEFVSLACKKASPHTGSIFEGRFSSTLVEDGRYLANCIRYVEYNPIRAGIVRRAADYRWSSRNVAAANETACLAGPVPEGWLERRVPQISQGTVFGSYAFVREKAVAFGR